MMLPDKIPGPCQYCGVVTPWPTHAWRSGVPPCCPGCRWIPGALGFGLLAVCSIRMALLAVVAWRMW